MKNADTVAFDVLRALARTARQGKGGGPLTLSAHPDVIETLDRFRAEFDDDDPYVRIGHVINHNPVSSYRIDRYDIVANNGYSGDPDGAADD